MTDLYIHANGSKIYHIGHETKDSNYKTRCGRNLFWPSTMEYPINEEIGCSYVHCQKCATATERAELNEELRAELAQKEVIRKAKVAILEERYQRHDAARDALKKEIAEAIGADGNIVERDGFRFVINIVQAPYQD